MRCRFRADSNNAIITSCTARPLSPPLIVSEEQIDEMVNILGEAIRETD